MPIVPFIKALWPTLGCINLTTYIQGNSDYEILCAVLEKLNSVVSSFNSLDEAVTELSSKYSSLEEFVNNYFNNLDVQNEINNKIEEMFSNGELDAIFADNAIMQFSSFIEASSSKVIKPDSCFVTKGYYTEGDGGGGVYLAEASGIIAMSGSLFATPIGSNNLKSYGAKCDGVSDDSSYLTLAFSHHNARIKANGETIFIGDTVSASPVNVEFNGGGCTFKSNNKTLFNFSNCSGFIFKNCNITAQSEWVERPYVNYTETDFNNYNTIRNNSVHPIIFGGNNVRVENVASSYSNTGFRFAGCTNFSIENCKSDHTLADGFYITNGCSRGYVRNCETSYAGDDCFSLVVDTSSSTIEDISVENCSADSCAGSIIAMYGCRNCSAKNMTSENQLRNVIAIGSQALGGGIAYDDGCSIENVTINLNMFASGVTSYNTFNSVSTGIGGVAGAPRYNNVIKNMNVTHPAASPSTNGQHIIAVANANGIHIENSTFSNVCMSINENKYITFKGCTFNLLAGLLVRNCDLVVIHDSIFNCSNTFSTPTDDEPTAGFANIRMQMFPNDIFDLSNNHFVNSEPPYLFSNYASNAKGVYLDSHPFTSISQTNYNVHTPCAVIDSSVGPVQYYSFSDGTPYIVTDGSTISEYGIIFDNAKHALYPNS